MGVPLCFEKGRTGSSPGCPFGHKKELGDTGAPAVQSKDSGTGGWGGRGDSGYPKDSQTMPQGPPPLVTLRTSFHKLRHSKEGSLE